MRDTKLLLPALVTERARHDPDRVFLQEVGGASLTWGGFDDAIRRWASAFRRIGVGAGDRVVTMLPACTESSCAWLGLAWLRGIEVPCNTAYRGRMLSYLVENSGSETMVVAARYLEQLAEVADEVTALRRVVVLGDEVSDGLAVELPWPIVSVEEFLAGADPVTDCSDPDPWDIAALFYTGGTTGPSKGVLSPWGQLYTQAIGSIPIQDLAEDDAFYIPYPMHHWSARTPMYVMALANGRAVIRERFNTAAFWDDVDTYRCTIAVLIGPMTAFLYQQEPRDDDAQHALEKIIIGPLPPYVDELKTRFGVQITTAFGSTEQGPAISTGWDTSSANWKSCGKLRQGYPGFEARVVDADDNEVAPGEVGELVVRSSEPWTLNLGYFNMAEKTVEAWRNGWFHSGDAFSYDEDGNFSFVDRANDYIRRRAENISSFEVEVEVNAHPLVVESAAIGVPSEYGEEEIKVFAVLKDGASLTHEELIEFLAPRMARFMVPRYIEFVAEFPKTEATLRVQKFKLREQPLNDATWDREQSGITLPR
jgi:crotonobetaine/carnitine-CoA ligase